MSEEYSEEELYKLLGELHTLTNDNVGESNSFDEYIEHLLKNDMLDDFTGEVTTQFINESNNPDPEYAKEGDSGFDLRAFIDEPVTLKSLERKLIPTGLKFALPPNTELQVRPRSGMAYKHGISVLNTPGTVDESYRGDVGIIAVNLSNEEYTINPGDRIAQGVIMNVIGQGVSKLNKVETLSETERGDSGFGSTGKN